MEKVLCSREGQGAFGRAYTYECVKSREGRHNGENKQYREMVGGAAAGSAQQYNSGQADVQRGVARVVEGGLAPKRRAREGKTSVW